MTLVHSSEISYTESGDSGDDLERLTYTSDGYLDDVHTWRNQYGADLVVLFTYVNDVGGIAWLLNTTSGEPEYGFSITRVQQASWTYTTIHEMGHNMGCHHHKEQNTQPGPGLFSYSAGWRWIGTDNGKYCSVMTYESGQYFADGQTHTRVGYFSNPDIVYQGVATGDAADGDNARTIREVKDVVSTYRSISYEDFESGDFTAGGWIVAGTTPAPSVTTGAKYTGTYGAQIPGSTGSRSITKSKSTEGYSSIHVKYDRRTTRTSLTLVVDWSTDGSTWNTLETTTSTLWASKDYALGTGADNNPNFRIRFRTTTGSTSRYAYIDNVQITGIKTQLQYTISGHIQNECNVPVEGVLVDANNGGSQDTTDVNGFYEVWVDYNWSGTVTPTKEHHTFNPGEMVYVDVLADQTEQNYQALNIYDLDCNGSIGFGDLRIMSENWLDGPDLPGDFYKDEDDIVNFLDFAEFAQHWLEGPIL
jgi:hypothetical protein